MNLDAACATALVGMVTAELTASYQRWRRVAHLCDHIELDERATALVLYWSTIEGGAFVGSMRRRGAITAAVEHGALLARAGRPVTDHFFVWGDEMATTARRLFGARPIVTVTGNPHEENVLQPALRQATRAEPSATATPALLVAFGRPNMIIAERSFTAAMLVVRDAAEILGAEVRFIVSVHPADRSGHWRALAAQSTGNLEILPAGAFYRHLHRAAGVVTMFSTAGSEAAFVGQPVFVVSPDQLVDRSGLAPAVVTEGAAYVAASAAQLADQVRQVVLDGDDPLARARAAHGTRFLHTDPDGSSSATVIADHLVSLRAIR